ncbi:Calpain-1 catalytic subunit [Triplophysa tibetana]|uniref:Calpain-1 catalytic subunit n=1 Tax=Triplophysa tibetana TaxID=1572043 RepID=A0A5A9MZB6_9TELE|nr:Calpain-1 catalytic subunit [Triplophysa tibetana]
MNRSEKQEIEFKYETESRKSSLPESYSKVFERVKSLTFMFPSETQLQDGPYVDSTFDFQPDMVWKRPKEICEYPQFIVDGATHLDICQGDLNDCWFLSAVASLSLYPSLMERVVPPGQSFQQGYNGCFFFQFWQYGEWCKVQVDDRLPMGDGHLMYLKSSNKNEFWPSLLEKAYAKLKGGYNALNMGFSHEAMADMTGGITEFVRLAPSSRNLGLVIRGLLQKGALINCSKSEGSFGENTGLGIISGHAYSVTGLEMIQTETCPVELVRIYNPWGKAEWEGPWSDKYGIEWESVSKEEQNRVQRKNLEDGEFWMALSDFQHNFQEMEVCHLSDDTLSAGGAIKRPWHCTSYHGKWIPFQHQPQYKLTLLEEDDDPSDPELTCSFLLALMQKQHRNLLMCVDLRVYKVGSEGEPVIQFTNKVYREIVLRERLAPGHYIIIPATSETNRAGEFLLRVLTEKGNHTVPVEKPVTDEISFSGPLSPCLSGLPSITEAKDLFMKHCTKGSFCRPLDLHNLLTEAIANGVFAGSEKKLSLEICKSFVVLMDIGWRSVCYLNCTNQSKGTGHLDWMEFQALWEKLRQWTSIFIKFDKNKNHTLEQKEIPDALTAAGIKVDDFILQLISLRYTEPDLTVSFPGFLFLLLKLACMISRRTNTHHSQL